MKKTLNLGLVLSILALLACEDDNDPRICNPPCSPPVTDMTIYTMQPASGHVGDAVTILVENFPSKVFYQGQPSSATYSGQHDYDDRDAPWVYAYVGDETAEIMEVFGQGVTIKVPPFLDPGEYTISLQVGSSSVIAPSKFIVIDPAL